MLEQTTVLSRLHGRQLSAVVFVQDYMQFQFDGPVLTTYLCPLLILKDGVLTYDDTGYKDSICDCIGSIVVDTFDEPDHRIGVVFENGAALQISLQAEDQIGPEAATFDDSSSNDFMVWRTGDQAEA
ncbi:MAG: hypothetical protein AAF224_01800 [Pseudomonadota bacterium]